MNSGHCHFSPDSTPFHVVALFGAPTQSVPSFGRLVHCCTREHPPGMTHIPSLVNSTAPQQGSPPMSYVRLEIHRRMQTPNDWRTAAIRWSASHHCGFSSHVQSPPDDVREVYCAPVRGLQRPGPVPVLRPLNIAYGTCQLQSLRCEMPQRSESTAPHHRRIKIPSSERVPRPSSR